MKTILEEAQDIIYNARNQAYGNPLDNHGCTAQLFSVYIGALMRRGQVELKAEDVCMFNILQKISRYATTGVEHRDTLVDIAGYAGNIEMVWNERAKRKK